MSARAGNHWTSRPTAVAVAAPYATVLDFASIREKLVIIRDTIVVLGLQIAFRASMFFRHLNY
jgi:hypothetical protein